MSEKNNGGKQEQARQDEKTASEKPAAKRDEKKRVVIFDTTLRDGEQSPGASMSLQEKLQVAEMLDEMGVDVIEAGFPIASPGDFESVAKVAEMVRQASVCGLARAMDKDIERAGEALKKAVNPRIHTFISTSPVHMKHKLGMEPEQVLEAVTASVSKARNFTSNVEWSAEDATRTGHDFLCRCVEAAIKAGAGTIFPTRSAIPPPMKCSGCSKCSLSGFPELMR